MPVSALLLAPQGTVGAAMNAPVKVLSSSAFSSISETKYCSLSAALPVTEAGAALRPFSQDCHPDSKLASRPVKPDPSDAEASETAAASELSKASASVNVVEPAAATGIWATWSMCPPAVAEG